MIRLLPASLRSFALIALSILAMMFVLPTHAADGDVLPPVAVTKEMRCPVCGMYPARYPKWMAQVVFTDRESKAFDSPADLFRFLHNMARYERKHVAADIAVIYLTDYAKGGWLEAKRTWLVLGSSARGPMNNADLPAFDSQAAAEQFAKSNGGKALSFDAVTSEVISSMGGHEASHTH